MITLTIIYNTNYFHLNERFLNTNLNFLIVIFRSLQYYRSMFTNILKTDSTYSPINVIKKSEIVFTNGQKEI